MNAFSTKGATTNQSNGLSLSSINRNIASGALSPKTKALETVKSTPIPKIGIPTNNYTGSMQNNRVLNASSSSLTPEQSYKNIIPTAPVTPKTTPTTQGMVNSGTSYQPTTNTGSNAGMVNQTQPIQTTQTQPSQPTIPVFSGMVGQLASTQPNKDYTEAQSEITKAYKEAANYARDTDLEKKYAMQNPEYRKEYGLGYAGAIEANTASKLAQLNKEAEGWAAKAGLANTQQGLQQTGLASAAGFAQPDQVPYSNQYINPLTGQPVSGGTSGSLNDAVSGVVQKLQSGQMTYNDALNALSGYGQGGVNALQSALPSGFNIAQSNALGGVQGTVGPAYNYADTALKNVEDIMGSLPAIQKTNIPILGSIARGFSTETGLGSEGTRALTGAVNTLRNAYASLLASSKGGTPTDYSGQALAEIPDNPTPNDILALRKNFETLGSARKEIYGNAGSGKTNQTNSTFAEQW